MIWLLGVIGIPILVVALLFFSFFSAEDDFMQIIRLRIVFSRLSGDWIHVLLILALGTLAELFFLYQLVVHVF